MENHQDKETFSYTYSAKQQEEINKIRKKYVVLEEDKMEQLRKLDKGVTQKAVAAALIAGISGELIFGFGMSLIMSELSEILGSYRELGMPLGVVIGIAGIVLVGCSYPIYNRTMRKERERIAPEIFRLTEELMK